MIDAREFWPEWQRLCKRFNREAKQDEADDYLEYLDSVGLTTEQAVAAARALWATREFFPRPADFLASEAAIGWTALLALTAMRYNETANEDVERERFGLARAKVPPRAWAAIQQIGGTSAIRDTNNLTALRKEYLRVYDAGLQEAAYEQLALPPMSEEGRKLIEAATPKLLAPK